MDTQARACASRKNEHRTRNYHKIFLTYVLPTLQSDRHGNVHPARVTTTNLPYMFGWSWSGMRVPGGKTKTPMEKSASCAMCRYRISPGAGGVMYGWAYGTNPRASGVSIAMVCSQKQKVQGAIHHGKIYYCRELLF